MFHLKFRTICFECSEFFSEGLADYLNLVDLTYSIAVL